MKEATFPVTLACALVAALASCSSDGGKPSPRAEIDPRPPTPAAWDRTVVRPDEAAAARARASCTFKRGALPDETLGASTPTGKDIPIENVVVLMQENRSFDHYFGRFGKYAGRTDVEGPPEGASNPDRIGPVSASTHPYQRAEHLCFLDTAHEWDAVRKQIDGGKMDGFYETNHEFKGEMVENPPTHLRNGERALWFYDEREIPFYYALAKEFGLGDHYFASVPGPTWPNRMYLYAATSFGRAGNFWPDIDALPFPETDAFILDELDRRRVDWKLYSNGGQVGAFPAAGVQLSIRWNRQVVFTMEDFYADAAAGKLPGVAYVDAAGRGKGPEADDEHPSALPHFGQKFISEVTRALFKSPQWSSSALFVMHDEHGGIYDHVAPPKACVPDDKPPADKRGPVEGAFDTYGPRVPFIVVSPYAKRGYVSHQVFDHASIVRFIQAKFRLPALTGRDANAQAPLDFFDFGSPPRSPPELPPAVIDQGELKFCKQAFPN